MEDETTVPAEGPGRERGPQGGDGGQPRHTRWLWIITGIAVTVLYMGDGNLEIAFGGRLHEVKRLLDADDADLGWVTGGFQIGQGVGCIACTLLAERLGTRLFLVGGSLLGFAPLAVIGMLVDPPAAPLWVVAVLWQCAGVGIGLMTPALTLHLLAWSRGGHAVQVVHAFKYLAIFESAGLVWWSLDGDVSVRAHYVWVGGLVAVCCVVAAMFPPSRVTDPRVARGADVRVKGVVQLGGLLTASILPLAVAINWATSVLEELGAQGSLRAGGQSGFAVANVVGALGFWALSRRRPETGPRRAVRGLAFAGIGTATLSALAFEAVQSRVTPDVVHGAAIAGFALVGLGWAPVFGLVQQAVYNVRAGRLGDSARVGVAITVQYAVVGVAMLALGYVAESRFGATGALALTLAVCLCVVVAARGWLNHSVRAEEEATRETAASQPDAPEQPAPTKPQASGRGGAIIGAPAHAATGKRRANTRALSIVTAVALVAWLAWALLDDIATTRRALELGCGVILLVFVHELGHIVTMRRCGIRASSALFIPCIGALISPKEFEGHDAETEGCIGIAGPIAGTVASYSLIGVYVVTGYAPLLPLALIGLTLNGLHMMPVPPLDGGRAAAAITRWLWLLALLGLGALVWWAPNASTMLLLATGVVSVIGRVLRERKQRGGYYEVPGGQRIALLGAYVGTWVAIIGGIALCGVVGGDALGLVE